MKDAECSAHLIKELTRLTQRILAAANHSGYNIFPSDYAMITLYLCPRTELCIVAVESVAQVADLIWCYIMLPNFERKIFSNVWPRTGLISTTC